MKRFTVLATALAIGVGSAFASSINVPWYVDFPTQNVDFGDPVATGFNLDFVSIVYLKNNTEETLVCTIEYFAPGGTQLGPIDPSLTDDPDGDGINNFGELGNTFTIAPLSALAFRPVADDPNDPATSPSGQEQSQGLGVPNRPRPIDSFAATGFGDAGLNVNNVPINIEAGDLGINGSLTVRWEGAPTDVQGLVSSFRSDLQGDGSVLTYSYSYLLPTGI